MKILYDYQAFTLQRFGGVSNCFVQLMSNLPKDVDYEIGVLDSENEHLRSMNIMKVGNYRRKENFISNHHFPFQSHLYRFFSKRWPALTDSEYRNRQFMIELLQKGDYDIFHPTYFDDYFMPYLPKDKPLVITIHDMIAESNIHNDEWQVEKKKILLERANHIIAVSENTKRDIMDYFHVPEQKISVIYHGYNTTFHDKGNSLFDFPYLLYVGTRFGYKNFRPMVKHLADFLLSHPDIKLICTGEPFSKEEKELFNDLKIENQVVQFYAADAQMFQLYSHALCFIFPSLYEGFGIPILEAYSAQCPVFLNHTSCFPEIAGDAAFFFDLDEHKANLNDKLTEFLDGGETERKKLIDKQNERLKFFSWKKSSQQLADAYKTTLKQFSI